jgi:hypothetical protein
MTSLKNHLYLTPTLQKKFFHLISLKKCTYLFFNNVRLLCHHVITATLLDVYSYRNHVIIFIFHCIYTTHFTSLSAVSCRTYGM